MNSSKKSRLTFPYWYFGALIPGGPKGRVHEENRRGGDSNPRYGCIPVRRFSKSLPENHNSLSKKELIEKPKTDLLDLPIRNYVTRQIIRDFLKLSSEEKQTILKLLNEVDNVTEKAITDIARENQAVGV